MIAPWSEQQDSPDGSQPCRCFDSPAMSTLCPEDVRPLILSVSQERHVMCVCVCVYLCVCVCTFIYWTYGRMYVCTWSSSHHMAPPPSRVASSSTCNSKKHKVPPDRAGRNALLASDCTARLQSNLSDDVVMGSPPHPWAPRLRRIAIPRLPAAPFCLLSVPPCPAVRGDRKHFSNMSLNLAP